MYKCDICSREYFIKTSMREHKWIRHDEAFAQGCDTMVPVPGEPDILQVWSYGYKTSSLHAHHHLKQHQIRTRLPGLNESCTKSFFRQRHRGQTSENWSKWESLSLNKSAQNALRQKHTWRSIKMWQTPDICVIYVANHLPQVRLWSTWSGKLGKRKCWQKQASKLGTTRPHKFKSVY